MEPPSAASRPKKTRFELIGWLFSNPIATFDNLLPVVRDPAHDSTDKSRCHTKQNVIQHWMFCFDKNRISYHSPDKNAVLWEVADNLIAFWTKKTTIELR